MDYAALWIWMSMTSRAGFALPDCRARSGGSFHRHGNFNASVVLTISSSGRRRTWIQRRKGEPVPAPQVVPPVRSTLSGIVIPWSRAGCGSDMRARRSFPAAGCCRPILSMPHSCSARQARARPLRPRYGSCWPARKCAGSSRRPGNRGGELAERHRRRRGAGAEGIPACAPVWCRSHRSPFWSQLPASGPFCSRPRSDRGVQKGSGRLRRCKGSGSRRPWPHSCASIPVPRRLPVRTKLRPESPWRRSPASSALRNQLRWRA